MPKIVHFGEFLKIWSLRSNSVTRHVTFNRTKIGGKRQNSNATFLVIFKQCVQEIKEELEVKMDELEEKTKLGMKNSNSALWQDNDQRVGRVEMVQKQVQNQLESLLNKSSADQNVLSTLATEVMKTAKKKYIRHLQ